MAHSTNAPGPRDSYGQLKLTDAKLEVAPSVTVTVAVLGRYEAGGTRLIAFTVTVRPATVTCKRPSELPAENGSVPPIIVIEALLPHDKPATEDGARAIGGAKVPNLLVTVTVSVSPLASVTAIGRFSTHCPVLAKLIVNLPPLEATTAGGAATPFTLREKAVEVPLMA